MKKCKSCKHPKEESDFYDSPKYSDGKYPICKDCARSKSRKSQSEQKMLNPATKRREKRSSALLRKFGITEAEYTRLLDKQKGVCAICSNPETAFDVTGKTVRHLAVDHDHASGVIRGLLCNRCNTALGKFGDSEEVLYTAIAYLKTARERL